MKEEHVKPIETKTPPTEKNTTSGGNIILAFVLIFIGCLFLANNLGIVSWTIWVDLWKFWPILLILFGLQFLLGKSLIAKITIAVITIAFLIFVMLYLLVNAGVVQNVWVEKLNRQSMPMRTEEVKTQTLRVMEKEFKNIEKRAISINEGIGKFILTDSPLEEYFILTTDTTDSASKTLLQSTSQNGSLDMHIRVPGKSHTTSMMQSRSRYEYTGVIGQPQIPTKLSFEVGAGEADIALDQVQLQDLAMQVGAGSANIELNEKTVPQRARLDIGLGAINLTVPKSVGLNITYEVGLGTFSIENQNLRDNGTYQTENYTTAQKKLDLSVEVGTGSITINRN